MSGRFLLPLVVLVLAGCAGPAGPGPGGRVAACDVSAVWLEPGLHAALPEGARRAGFALLDTSEEDPWSIPFRHEDLDARDPAYRLMSVRWSPPDGPDAWLWPVRPGEYELAVHAGFDDPRMLPSFRAFLDAAGLGDAPERPAWERALENAHRGEWPPRVVLVGEPDFVPLYERLRAEDGLPEQSNGPGGFQLLGSEWGFSFRLPAWFLVKDDVRLHVDARDRVYATATHAPGEPPWEAFQARMNETFARMGLPPPTFAEARAQETRGC